MTPAGIEPATFRFVAQHLNHCATAVPYQRFLPLIISSGVRRSVSGSAFHIVSRNRCAFIFKTTKVPKNPERDAVTLIVDDEGTTVLRRSGNTNPATQRQSRIIRIISLHSAIKVSPYNHFPYTKRSTVCKPTDLAHIRASQVLH